MLRRLYELATDPRRTSLLGLLLNAGTFRRRQPAVSHRDAMRDPRDATVLYDDIWGAP